MSNQGIKVAQKTEKLAGVRLNFQAYFIITN